jgi:hypothetical protein
VTAVSHYTWDDFPVDDRLGQDEPFNRASDTDVEVNGQRFRQLGDNGWFQLVAWFAGPRNVVRAHDDRAAHTVRVTTHDRAGGATTTTAPRTEADQDIIEETVNEYLAEAGVPARPRGFSWHLRVPAGRQVAELWRAIHAEERQAAKPLEPADTASAARAALAVFYG